MKMMIYGVLIVLLLIVLYLAVAIGSTYFNRSIKTVFRKSDTAPQTLASAELTVMTWNLGYAGLGEESDFKADGGDMLLPPSVSVVEKNLAGIQATLTANPVDVYLLQETAAAGLLTRGVDVRAAVADTLSDWTMFFSSDIGSRMLPEPLRLEHGPSMFTRLTDQQPELVRLPSEPEPIMGFIPRHYHMQVSEVEVAGTPWAVINLHLAAFDEGGDTRNEQLRAVIDFAEQLHAEGKSIVIGGDWNMRLTQTDFPSTSTEDALFWIHDFPQEELPESWHLAFDANVPTVRTNERPFQPDENYRTIIDGLLLSPDVELVDVRGIDLAFEYTDHQPAVYRLRRRTNSE
ncbi:endonuclease/exonuclease/phosphatase family protein [Ponticaulis koreensis]|uniref:endonuclease/exonuclease/phosphatase family protein n=1 Tax=Ponticaulis koreensis TaxID=1123045 RepID=UPI0003B4AB23|nr:endonuclease/exonuclease/phosphatase family protein [Ponticaulis koreensis]